MTSRARDIGRSHHRKGPETRERAEHYLDPDAWGEMELSRLDKARCSEVRGELLLMSAILDGAMRAIFSPSSKTRRLLEIDWVLKSREPISAWGICDILSEFGWARTSSGWPTDYEKLCKTVVLGYKNDLRLETS
jgi:hypothetical protein